MAAKESEAAGSFLVNPQAWLALLTLAGGLWLVSNKLTSNRPVAPVGDAKDFIGDQNVEARLWEDPFKYVPSPSVRSEDEASARENRVIGKLETLVAQISQKKAQSDGVVLLPVMLPGGQYSEDKEARIRSRFAIISALGRSAYAPDDAEHIGAVSVRWPTQRQLAAAKQKLPNDALPDRLWAAPGKEARLFGVSPETELSTMDVRYEWYRPRSFAPGSANKKDRPAVLVLWLDDTYFEDQPLLRLPLFLEPLLEGIFVEDDTAARPVRLIGPRRSSMLRAMLPKWGGETEREKLAKKYTDEEIERFAKRVLGQVDVYSATASAMDEVLVNAIEKPDASPRSTVKELLQRQGFHAVYNFAATDGQLAEEIYYELELRGAGLKKKENHVVLINEWDTFYGRMLSLTYAARLAKQQDAVTSGADYLERETKAAQGAAPKNFHSFVYLRGLDGQTIGAGGAGKEGADDSGKKSSRPASLEDLARWSPDINKAEGQAQFDYLGRLGDRMEQLQQKLRLEGGGRIAAIGIVGSDVYDTLLILQALRQRFPNVLFFTTDLDVRFLHPHEREWARNLIVASSYGLQLHHTLQETVAPFRDSTQTAQFAATLAAFDAPGLRDLEAIPPRRFEIGNGVAVDLSVQPDYPLPGPPRNGGERHLHPLTLSQHDHPVSRRMIWSLVAGALALLGASLLWDRLRRVTWQGFSYPCRALEFSEEDIGGPEGAEMLLNWLRTPPQQENVVAAWLLGDLRLAKIDAKLTPLRSGEAGDSPGGKLDKPADSKPDTWKWAREDALAELSGYFVARLNQCFPQTVGNDDRPKQRDERLERLRREVRAGVGPSRVYWALLPSARAMAERAHIRMFLDAFLDRMEAPSTPREAKEAVTQAQPAAATAGAALQTIETSPPAPPVPPVMIKIAVDFYLRSRRPAEDAAMGVDEAAEETLEQSVVRAARSARQAAGEIYALRWRGLANFWLSVACFGMAAGALGWAIWWDAFHNPEGEPFSLTNGTSAWPAQIVRLFVFLAAGYYTVRLVRQRREFFSTLTRTFRFARPEGAAADNRASAEVLWFAYCDDCASGARWGKILGGVGLYFIGLIAIYWAQGEEVLNPVRGGLMRSLNYAIVLAALLGLLVLAFLTIDAALRCRDFIKKISEHPTEYPEATRRHFSRKQGQLDEHYIDEWMDLQLIAELTEKVGRLVYYPAGLVLLLLLARNSWWDAWSWPESLIVGFVLNFILALASVVILQCAARDAKRKAEESMESKVKRLQAKNAPSEAANNASQAEKLLEEMRHLRRGAFVPFWENPVVGAVFLSSGGTTLLQMLIWFMNR